MYQHIDRPTRGRGSDNPSLLDLVFTMEEGNVVRMEHHSPYGKSDHSVLIFQFRCYCQQEARKKKKLYYDKADYSQIKRELHSIDWEAELDSKDPNEQWESFMSRLDSIDHREICTLQGNKG